MNLFVRIPADARPRFQLCVIRGESGTCDEIAFWWCYPGGDLTRKIPMCDACKQQAEQAGSKEVAS